MTTPKVNMLLTLTYFNFSVSKFAPLITLSILDRDNVLAEALPLLRKQVSILVTWICTTI